MKLIICKTFSISVLFISLAYAEEKKYFKDAKYFEWGIYSNKKKSLCYAITKPRKSEGKYDIRGKVNLLVGRNTRKKNENFVAVDFGYPFKKNTIVDISIDNKYFFKLKTFDETAWTRESDIKQLGDLVIKEMIKGNKLVAMGVSKRGTITKDIYSLRGFSKAFKKIKQMCE